MLKLKKDWRRVHAFNSVGHGSPPPLNLNASKIAYIAHMFVMATWASLVSGTWYYKLFESLMSYGVLVYIVDVVLRIILAGGNTINICIYRYTHGPASLGGVDNV